MKKLICIILVFITLLTTSASYIVLGESDTYTKKELIVDVLAQHKKITVYTNESGNILVDTDILSYWGGMEKKTSGSSYVYYYDQQSHKSEFKKEISINQNGQKGSATYSAGDGWTKTIVSVTFSDAYQVKVGTSTKLYLPLTEFLPLLDAKLEVTDDGILHIYTSASPLFLALGHGPSANPEWYAFNTETDIFAFEVYGATGYVLDSIFNGLRFDRLDFITNSGLIKDYSSLFKSLLQDNETYLSAFDEEQTPLDEGLSSLSEDLEWFTDRADVVNGYYEYITKSEIHKSLKTFGEFSGALDNTLSAVDGALKVMKYSDAYIHQVEDHRKMLEVVYGGKYYDSSNPICVAAKDVTDLYGNDTSKKIISATNTALRDYLSKMLSSTITSGIKPYTTALKWVSLALPDAMDEFSDAAKVFYLKRITSDAIDVYQDYRNTRPNDSTSLNNLRLALIMALESSKYSFDKYNPSAMEKDLNEWLEMLYLASDSVECNSADGYAIRKNYLSRSVNLLQLNDVDGSQDSDSNDEEDDSDEIIVASGTCGDNLSWVLHSGVLEISGIGEMFDFKCAGEYAPWEDWREDITKVIIHEGVTSISSLAFAGCINLKSIEIPNTLTEIADNVFYDTKISSVKLPEGITELHFLTFNGCELERIYLPKSITYIDASAFEGTQLHHVYYAGSQEDWNKIEIFWFAGPTTDDEGNLDFCYTLYNANMIFDYEYN